MDSKTKLYLVFASLLYIIDSIVITVPGIVISHDRKEEYLARFDEVITVGI